jgi:hypothetical protein
MILVQAWYPDSQRLSVRLDEIFTESAAALITFRTLSAAGQARRNASNQLLKSETRAG